MQETELQFGLVTCRNINTGTFSRESTLEAAVNVDMVFDSSPFTFTTNYTLQLLDMPHHYTTVLHNMVLIYN